MMRMEEREAALSALAEGYHERAARLLDVRELGGQLVKVYAIEAPGRSVDPGSEEVAAWLRLAEAQLARESAVGSTGLGCVILHAGGDGDYVLVHTWVESYMSRLAVFTGPAGVPGELRPGPAGLAPCVWEASVLAQERDAYVRRVLAGSGPLAGRVAAWRDDTL